MSNINDKDIYHIYFKLCDSNLITENERMMLIEYQKQTMTEKSTSIFIRSLCLLNDPDLEEFIQPYLDRVDMPNVASDALICLCRLGLAQKYRGDIMKMLRSDYPDDKRFRIVGAAITCIGLYLHEHPDQEFSQIIRQFISRTDDPLLRSARDNYSIISARMAASVAMGADPAVVVDDVASMNEYIARFLAERGHG